MTDTPSTGIPTPAIDSATPMYVHHLLDAYLTGQPLNFHDAPVPLDVQRRLQHAAALEQLATAPLNPDAAARAHRVFDDLTRAQPGDLFAFEQLPGQYVMVAVARLTPSQPGSEATR